MLADCRDQQALTEGSMVVYWITHNNRASRTLVEYLTPEIEERLRIRQSSDPRVTKAVRAQVRRFSNEDPYQLTHSERLPPVHYRYLSSQEPVANPQADPHSPWLVVGFNSSTIDGGTDKYPVSVCMLTSQKTLTNALYDLCDNTEYMDSCGRSLNKVQ